MFDILCNDPQLVTFGISAQSLGLALEKSLLLRGRFFSGNKKKNVINCLIVINILYGAF